MIEPPQAQSLPIDETVRRYLEESGTPYKLIQIDPDYADTVRFCDKYGYPLERSVNCILVTSKSGEKQYAACLVQATQRLDVNHTVRSLMGVRRLSFASAEETVTRTGMTPGGVTPFALPPDIPIYIDPPITELSDVILGGGGRTTKIIVSAAILERLPNAHVVEGLSLVPEG